MPLTARNFLLCLSLLALAEKAFSVQVYALYGEACSQTTGAIVEVDEESASVLTFAGQVQRVPLNDVQLLARYDVLENPFPRIQSAEAATLLTVTSESSEGTFRAFATDFFEDLVLFLDDAGKIRVVEMDEIVAIVRQRTETGPAPASLPIRPVRLVPPPGRERCAAVTSSELRDKPPVERVATQVMADKLRIDSFWTRMRTGYRDLESLRERTLFYARPILFDQKTRLGLIGERGGRKGPYELEPTNLDTLPLYLEFGGGSAYRFQSATSLGYKSWKMLPQIRPIAAVRSEFKSHLLHGTFLGNLSGFTAGKSIYGPRNWDSDPDFHRHAVWLDSSFNHLTLLGVDYGPWSLSYGYYFPSFIIGQREEFREVTAVKAASVVRLGYLLTGWQLDVYGFNVHMEDESGLDPEKPDELEMRRYGESFPGKFVRSYSEHNVPVSARLASSAAKAVLTVFLPKDLMLVGDVAFMRTTYKETALNVTQRLSDVLGRGTQSQRPDDDAPPNPFAGGTYVDNKVEQTLWATRAAVRMDLGQWVALAAEAGLERAKTEGGFQGSEGDRSATDQILTYLASLELLL